VAIIDETQLLAFARSEVSGDIEWATVAVNAATEIIEGQCQRKFAAAAVASARLYVPTNSDVLRIHDCTTVTLVTEDGTTVASTDYQLEPVNLLDWTGKTVPCEQIRRLSGCWYRNGAEATVSVTGTWGWSAIPSAISQAAFVLAKSIVKTRDPQFAGDFSWVIEHHADMLNDLRSRYKRAEAWGIA
jgi:hypothetical protein